MIKNYYYLISSLPELKFGNGDSFISIKEFVNFCSEELKDKDFETLKKLFIFNDIVNAINHKEKGFSYLFPSYYSEEDFKKNLNDTVSFLPFMAEFFYNKKGEKRKYPEASEIDELVTLLYQNIDEFGEGFIKDYLIFELYLKNITTALSAKSNEIDYTNKIIQYDDITELIKKSTSQDMGLSKHIDYMEKIIEVYKDNDLVKIEKTIEEIRWNFLEERAGIDYFSENTVYAYAVKLLTIDRWMKLNELKGDEIINNLINKISESIKFS